MANVMGFPFGGTETFSCDNKQYCVPSKTNSYMVMNYAFNGSYFYDLNVVIISHGPHCFNRLHNSHLGQGINIKWDLFTP
jgi:hypothetical protein